MLDTGVQNKNLKERLLSDSTVGLAGAGLGQIALAELLAAPAAIARIVDHCKVQFSAGASSNSQRAMFNRCKHETDRQEKS